MRRPHLQCTPQPANLHHNTPDRHHGATMTTSTGMRTAFAALGILLTAGVPVLAQPHAAKPGKPQQPAAIPQPEKTFPKNIVWSLYSFNGKPVNGDLNFQIDENNRGTGSSGCNTWSATMVPVNGQRIGMGPIAITKKTCAKDVMQMEVVYLVSLRSGPAWDLVGPDIVIKGQQGGEMKFRRSL